METLKLNAFVKLFPFLRSTRENRKDLAELNKAVESLSITIKRMDKNLLSLIPEVYYWDGSMGSTDKQTIIDFILNDDSIIQNAVSQKGESGSNYAHSSTKYWDGQSILDAIYEKQVPDKIKYIVVYNDDYSNWDQSYDCNCVNIIIYKLPKDFTLEGLLKEEENKVLAEIQAQSNF